MRVAGRVALIALLLELIFVVSGFLPVTWYRAVITGILTGTAVAPALRWTWQSRR
ncbi:hypothetical protein ACGFNU_38595 [Spirillospora sp. NPDC048911]|uniref:hypothetical protein n=1 Tax=Spirillospora sp. NPDC048911 TaxID=3364527 RepID=UPI00371071B0